jgi:hypothetical protein
MEVWKGYMKMESNNRGAWDDTNEGISSLKRVFQ